MVYCDTVSVLSINLNQKVIKILSCILYPIHLITMRDVFEIQCNFQISEMKILMRSEIRNVWFQV